MTTPHFLHAPPAAGFDEPFEMLVACHQRVQRMLQLLQRLQTHLAGHGADEPGQQAARDVMRYFDIAGPAHHEDEERHLFPLLLAGADRVTAALVRQLQQDHVAMAAQWRAVRADLQAVAQGTWSAALQPVAAERWASFADLYGRHIAAEEDRAYPAARSRLDAAALRAMGAEMAARRGVR